MVLRPYILLLYGLGMYSELRLKKLRGSGGYVMASVTDAQQIRGNLGGPDLFLAPIGRLNTEKITKYYCNTCDKEYGMPPRIDYESPNELVAENLVLAERGRYVCDTCNYTIAEYRNFKKPDETAEVGLAKPASVAAAPATPAPAAEAAAPQVEAPVEEAAPVEAVAEAPVEVAPEPEAPVEVAAPAETEAAPAVEAAAPQVEAPVEEAAPAETEAAPVEAVAEAEMPEAPAEETPVETEALAEAPAEAEAPEVEAPAEETPVETEALAEAPAEAAAAEEAEVEVEAAPAEEAPAEEEAVEEAEVAPAEEEVAEETEPEVEEEAPVEAAPAEEAPVEEEAEAEEEVAEETEPEVVAEEEAPVEEVAPEAEEEAPVEEEVVEVPEGITIIQGMDVYDQFAMRTGSVAQVGVDESLSPVLLVKADDGTISVVPCSRMKTLGQIILLGEDAPPEAAPANTQDDCCQCDTTEAAPAAEATSEPEPPKQGDCSECGVANTPDSKFCEECGNDLS